MTTRVNSYVSQDYLSQRQRLDRQRSELENERASFESHWKDLARFILPRRSRFTPFDTNEGGKRYRNIVNSTGTRSARSLSTGMMSNITNPARPWFRLSLRDSNNDELGEDAKEWLHNVTRIMSDIFLKSNLYDVLQIMYLDIGTFGTCCMMIEDDDEDIVRYTSLPIGSYLIGNDSKDRPRVFIREFRLTIRQVVERFCEKDRNGNYDLSILSTSTENLYVNGNHDQWVDICHHIYPNDNYDDSHPLYNKTRPKRKKRYRSVYYEKGDTAYGTGHASGYDTTNFLRDSGMDHFPILVGRWSKRSEDVYGVDCPGMLALGDIRALQLMEKRKAELVALITKPPMVANANVVSDKTTLLPGDVTYVTQRGQGSAFEPAIKITHGTADIREDIKEHENRIRESFYEDIFLMLSRSDRREITAREVDERHEEKLTALGAVLDRINKDILEPLIDRTFEKAQRKGYIPKPPESIQGKDIRVEYESIMAQAQKLIGLSSLERAAGFYGEMSALNPELLDNFNTDELLRHYGEMVSLPPGIVRDPESLAAIRQQKQQAQQQQEQAMMASEEAKAIKDLSQAELGGDNALSALVGGQASPGQGVI